jgi:CheY-like chemotaxis protein
MELSKYGGNKDGIGLYELMVVPRHVYKKAISAIKENRVDDFYDLLGVRPSCGKVRSIESSRILVIEDKLELAQSVEKALKSRGYNVSYTASKDELDTVKKSEINLIILDMMMPDVDALNICRILKDAKQTACIPIIIINGNNDEKDIVEGLKAGADDYIGKDFSIVELASRVKAVLRTYN